MMVLPIYRWDCPPWRHNPPAKPAPRPIVRSVSVNGNRSLVINWEPVALERLEARQREIFNTRVNRVIFVRGHRELEFRDVAQVIDAAHGAGIVHVGLMPAI